MKTLNENDLTKLREKGIIGQSEVAFFESDVLIVEDVVTRVRRTIDKNAITSAGLTLESTRRVLHG